MRLPIGVPGRGVWGRVQAGAGKSMRMRLSKLPLANYSLVGTEFGEGDETKQKSGKKSTFSLNGGKALSEEGCGKEIVQERQCSEEVRAILREKKGP